MEHVRSYVRSDMKIVNPDYEIIRLFIKLCTKFPISRGGGIKLLTNVISQRILLKENAYIA